MNPEEQLLVLLGMTEQQQKTITAAVEELKQQTASLNGIAPELQKTVQGVRLNKRHQSSIGFIEKPQMAWPYAIFKLPNFNHV